jgi:hypothetical protein
MKRSSIHSECWHPNCEPFFLEEDDMSSQQSQKRGIRSEAQKVTRARDAYEPIPPSNPVDGAFGEHGPESATDEEASLRLNEKARRKSRSSGKDH